MKNNLRLTHPKLAVILGIMPKNYKLVVKLFDLFFMMNNKTNYYMIKRVIIRFKKSFYSLI